jgi:hypothetical protein
MGIGGDLDPPRSDQARLVVQGAVGPFETTKTEPNLARNRKFESSSLQRRVRSEPCGMSRSACRCSRKINGYAFESLLSKTPSGTAVMSRYAPRPAILAAAIEPLNLFTTSGPQTQRGRRRDGAILSVF